MKIESAGWGSIGEERKEVLPVAGNGSNSKWMVRGTVWEGKGLWMWKGRKRYVLPIVMCYSVWKCNYANFYPDKAKKLSTDKVIYLLFNS